jgi:hypoxia-inducible factor (prolyl hydroxylase)
MVSPVLALLRQVINDMNRYGVCVVDDLLGEARGAAVLREVQSMYSSGAFQDGQLVKGKDSQSKSIRGDKITWVDGREPNCKNISVLVKLLDNIVMGANTVTNNGKLGSYRIKERSKVCHHLTSL